MYPFCACGSITLSRAQISSVNVAGNGKCAVVGDKAQYI